MKNTLLSIYSFTDKVGKLTGYLASFLLAFVTLIIFWGVMVREISPSLWVDPFAIYSMVALAFVGSAYTMQRDDHIRVDIVISTLKDKHRWGLEIFTYTLAIGFVAVLAVASTEMTIDAYVKGKTDIQAIMTPMFIPYMFVPIGSLLLLTVMIGKVLKNICLLKGWLQPEKEEEMEH